MARKKRQKVYYVLSANYAKAGDAGEVTIEYASMSLDKCKRHIYKYKREFEFPGWSPDVFIIEGKAPAVPDPKERKKTAEELEYEASLEWVDGLVDCGDPCMVELMGGGRSDGKDR